MTDHVDRPADTTRLQILHAAARQFARKSYSSVSLDDILADAEVTKGAMYFHFRSKHALATAIIETREGTVRGAIDELVARRLSGLETLIDVGYFIAVDDIGDEMARAALNLLESLGRTDGLQARVLAQWVKYVGEIARQAIDDGDIVGDCDPDAIAKLLVSMYLGLRQTSNLADPEQLLPDLQSIWALTLPGFATRDRVDYLTKFVKRRTAVALKRAKPFDI